MARRSSVARAFHSTVTPLLLLLFLAMPLSVESSETVGTGAADEKSRDRRRIKGLKPVSLDDLSFKAIQKEAEKHVDTFVESGEFDVNLSLSNTSNFHLSIVTYTPPVKAVTLGTQQSQLQQVKQPPGQQPHLQQTSMQPPKQPPKVQQPPKQPPKVQQPPKQSSQVQQPLKQPPHVQQSKRQLKDRPESSMQTLARKPAQVQKQQKQPHQGQRSHRVGRRSDVLELPMDEGHAVEADDAFGVKRSEERNHHSRRRTRKTSSDEGYERYFSKKFVNDYFRKAKTDEESDDEDELDRFKSDSNGIETDVTMSENTNGETELERDVKQRDVVASNQFVNPEEDGTLTLERMANVLNANQKIERLQLFSDNPSSSVRWDEPAMMTNCWLHKLLAVRYTFSPSCKPDGTYANKQCYLERCWCVDDEGRPRDRKFLTRFAYKKYGSLLYCTPQIHPVVSGNLLRPPESEFEPIVHTPSPPPAQ